MILDLYFTPHIKINSRWIKDLSVRPEIVLEETRGSLAKSFLNLTKKHRQQKQKLTSETASN